MYMYIKIQDGHRVGIVCVYTHLGNILTKYWRDHTLDNKVMNLSLMVCWYVRSMLKSL